jgi:periplasmic copper chaperone A
MTRYRARRSRRMRRILLTIAGAGLWLLVLAGPAFAHVTISPGFATQGSTAELTFRVPNEELKADTTELQVQVPTAHPIAQFLVKPVAGWTITVQTVKLAQPVVSDDGSFTTAVSLVTWKGGKIPPGEYQDFSVSADPLPTGVSQLVFKAIQTYSNGDIVRWIDLPQAGQPVPAHPAPILTLTPASAGDGTVGDGSGSDASGTDGSSISVTAAPAAAGDSATAALALGAAGLVAGLLGLAAGGSVWLRSRTDRRPRGGQHGGGQP